MLCSALWSDFTSQTLSYDRVDYFDKFRGISYMQMLNEPWIPKILSMPKYKKLINNERSAFDLDDTEIDKSKIYNLCDYTVAFRSFLPIGTEEVPNVGTNKSLLRVNKEKNVVYTVQKSGKEYIFTAFHINYDETLKDMHIALLSRWKVIKIPNIEFFKNIKPGITTSDDVSMHDVNFHLYKRDNEYISNHIFADKLGTIVHIVYKKNEDNKFCVSKVEWESNGWNVLPYLLPIDRQLIDPNYVPPVSEPGCTIL